MSLSFSLCITSPTVTVFPYLSSLLCYVVCIFRASAAQEFLCTVFPQSLFASVFHSQLSTYFDLNSPEKVCE